MGAELTVLRKVEDDCCQSNPNGFHFILIAAEVGSDAGPYLIEDPSEQLQGVWTK
jgi:hypothetical protein